LHQGGEKIAAGDYEFRNRVYSPSLGRWLSNDPLGFEAGDQNWYRAIANNPGNGNDPSGLDAGIGGLVVDEMPEIPRNPYGIWVPKNPEDTFWGLIREDVWDTGSQIVGMLPGVGDYKDIQEVITGYDLITGEFLTPGQRILTAGAAFLPGVGAATIRKLGKKFGVVGEVVGKNVDELPTNPNPQPGKIQIPSPNPSKSNISLSPPSELAKNLAERSWITASLEKAIREHAGDNYTDWITKTGKRIYENPATGRQIVQDIEGGYFRIFQPKTIGSREGNYLNLIGNESRPARYGPNGIHSPPLRDVDKGLFQQETHFFVQELLGK
jgi:RHS repeat-associated protein